MDGIRMWIDWRTKEKPLPICGRGHHDVICYLRIESAQSDWIGIRWYLSTLRKKDRKPIRRAHRRVWNCYGGLVTTPVSVITSECDLRIRRVRIRGRIYSVGARWSPTPSLGYGFGEINIARISSGTASAATHALQRKAKYHDYAAAVRVVQGESGSGGQGRGSHRRCGSG